MSTGVFFTVSVIAFMGGVASRSFSFPDIIAGVGALFAFVLVLSITKKLQYAILAIVCTIVCFTLGAVRYSAVESGYDARALRFAVYEGEQVDVLADVVLDPEARESSTVLLVQPIDTDVRIRVRAERGLDVRYGDRLRVTGELTRPEAFTSDLGRTFHYEEYLRAHGVTHEIRFAEVEVGDRNEGGHLLFRVLYDAKYRFARGIEMMLPEPHASLALGLLLGEKQGLGERLEDVFRVVGIIHIVVLSGYNLTIIAEALGRILRHFLRPRLRATVGAIAIVLFALMVGPSATVVRATMMALLLLYARTSGKTYDALRALMLAGSAMVLLNPYVLCFDPGFQFSFLATLGLIAFGPHLDRAFAFVPTRGGIREYASATIATQIMVTPLLLYSIGSVSMIALVANVLILIAVPPAMLFVFLAGLVGVVAPTMYVVTYPAYLALSYIVEAAELLARVPFAELVVPPFSFWYVVVAYVLMALSYALYVMQSKTPRGSTDPRGVHSATR